MGARRASGWPDTRSKRSRPRPGSGSRSPSPRPGWPAGRRRPVLPRVAGRSPCCLPRPRRRPWGWRIPSPDSLPRLLRGRRSNTPQTEPAAPWDTPDRLATSPTQDDSTRHAPVAKAARRRRLQHANCRTRRRCSSEDHPAWQPRQAEIAAAGGADRRPPRTRLRRMDQSREAHHPAWPPRCTRSRSWTSPFPKPSTTSMWTSSWPRTRPSGALSRTGHQASSGSIWIKQDRQSPSVSGPGSWALRHQGNQLHGPPPSRYNFLFSPQGRPCGRPPPAAVLGRQTAPADTDRMATTW
jgi:hypothetical protein